MDSCLGGWRLLIEFNFLKMAALVENRIQLVQNLKPESYIVLLPYSAPKAKSSRVYIQLCNTFAL